MASILISLAGAEPPSKDESQSNKFDDNGSDPRCLNYYSSTTLMLLNKLEKEGVQPYMEDLKAEVDALLSGNDEVDVDFDLLTKDKSTCSNTELEMIRRERNRMHAKKTRMRKKKMIQYMETVSDNNIDIPNNLLFI